MQQDRLNEEVTVGLIPDRSTLVRRVKVQEVPAKQVAEPRNRLERLSALELVQQRF
jgi:hypothetical protein